MLMGRRVRNYNFFRTGRRNEREKGNVPSSVTNVCKKVIQLSSVLISPVPMPNSAVFAASGVTKLHDVLRMKGTKICVPQDGLHDMELLPSMLAKHYNL